MAGSFVSSAAATSKRKFRCGSSRCRPAMATSSSTNWRVAALPVDAVHAVDQGVREQMAAGVIAGYPVIDVKVTVLDGSHGDLDSAAVAFRFAGAAAFKEGVRKARPVLLEPIMNVIVVTMPEVSMGDISGDLSRRRGVLQSIEDSPAGKIATRARAACGNVRLCDGAALTEPRPSHLYDGILAVRGSACDRQSACHQRSRRLAAKRLSQIRKRKQSCPKVNSRERSRT